MSEYADRDIIGLGQHYTRHVMAMTSERLHEKSDIAAELAWRDEQIERLRAELAACREDAERYRWLRECDWNASPLCVVVRPKENVRLGSDCPSWSRLDAAIDAAREGK